MTREDGLTGKYRVERVDGRDLPGGDKDDAQYFVLDYVHDVYAHVALLAYAAACEAELPRLASDMRAAVVWAGLLMRGPGPEEVLPPPPGTSDERIAQAEEIIRAQAHLIDAMYNNSSSAAWPEDSAPLIEAYRQRYGVDVSER